jgi:hypothetical protein
MRLPLFQNLLERNISSDLFNNLFTIKELTRLSFVCKSIKARIEDWLKTLELEHFVINYEIDDKELLLNFKYLHQNIKKICIPSDYYHHVQLSVVGFHYLTLFQERNLQVLVLGQEICKGALLIITSSLHTLIELFICNSPLVSNDEFDSITLLTNLKTLTLGKMIHFDGSSAANYHSLKLMSFRLFDFEHLFNCNDGSFLSTLTTLSILDISFCNLFDFNLNLICFNCRSIKDLTVTWTNVTQAGWDNIQLLTQLESLHLNYHKKQFPSLHLLWENITAIATLTSLDLGGSYLTDADQQSQLFHLKLTNYCDSTSSLLNTMDIIDLTAGGGLDYHDYDEEEEEEEI